MKAFVYSARPYDMDALSRENSGKHELVFSESKLRLDSVQLASGCEAVALFTADDASGKVLEALHRIGVRHIALRSVGYDHVDLAAAGRLGLSVANVPGYSPYSVAEHAVAMLLALNRKLPQSRLLMALQDYRLDSLVGFDVFGKTVGIVGTGKIGLAFAKIMLGFGARLIAFDPAPSVEARNCGIEYTTLDDLLRQSDIISLHCPLNDNTRGLLSKKEFLLMKQDAILVNTARGAIINTEDLLTALDERKIGGACLDVYEKEKGLYFEDRRSVALNDPVFARLFSHPNVLMTGHQGFLTREALAGIAQTTIFNLDCWSNKKPSPHELQ